MNIVATFRNSWLRFFAIPLCLLIGVLAFMPHASPRVTQYPQAERCIEPVGVRVFTKSTFTELAGDFPDLSKATWERVDLPNTKPLPLLAPNPPEAPMARVWFHVRYALPQNVAPNELIAIYDTRIMGGAYTVWVNGTLIEANLENWRMEWNNPLFVRLPLHTVQPGKPVDIYIAIPYTISQGYAMGSLSVGPVSELQARYESRVLWQSDIPRTTLLIALILGAVSFHVWLSNRGERIHLLLSLTAFAWLVCNMQYFFDYSDNDTALRWYGSIVDSAVTWVFVLTFLFAFRLDKRTYPKAEKAFLGYCIGLTFLTLPWNWQVNGLVIQHTCTIILGSGMAMFMLWQSCGKASLEFRVMTAAIWTMLILGGHDLYFLTSQNAPDHSHLFPYCSFSLFGALTFLMYRRYVRSLSDAENMNVILDHRVKEREAELQERHLQIQALELEKERNRLTRDLHDCIKSPLALSRTEIMNGTLSAKEIDTILQSFIDSLGVLIESRTVEATDLPTILGMVRFRLSNSMDCAGIRLDWHMQDDLPPLPWLNPTAAGHITLILTEALTNVHKHASANMVSVHTEAGYDHHGKPCIVVKVADNGNGYAPIAKAHGNGIKIMQGRAQDIGCTVTIAPGKTGGTIVTLFLPFDLASAEPHEQYLIA